MTRPSLDLRGVPFGLDIFQRSEASFSPLDYGPVDPGYRVGAGDEIIIDTWGGVSLHYAPVVDRSGAITVPVAGRIVVSGLTVPEVEDIVHRSLARYHDSLRPQTTGSRSYLSVSLGKLRPITVFILGEVERPGAYTLGAAATMFHALYASGGPTPEGSFRQVVRYGVDGPPDTLDVYDYLIRGDRTKDARLRHLDVVFVPVIGRSVSVRGAVRRPARYELKPTDSLGTLIRFAGGFGADATPKFSQIERVEGSVRRLIDISLSDTTGLALRDGDVLTVGAALSDVKLTVTAYGEVRRSEDYAWVPGMTVADLLRLADGPTEDAYLRRADVVRLLPEGETEVHPVDLEQIVQGDTATAMLLKPYDRLVVRSKYDFLPADTVTVHGEVRQPGTFPYRQEMSLGDLLFVAGGLTPAAYTREVRIVRQYLTRGQVSTDTLAISLTVPLRETDVTTWPKVPLKPNDQVFIRRRPDWETPAMVRIVGQVSFPGSYQLSTRQERLLGMIEQAGGPTEYAYVPGIYVDRVETGRIATDFAKASAHPQSAENLVLQPGDEVVVPAMPQTVTIKGAVGIETNVVYEPGMRVDHYLELAGGVLDSADTGRIKLVQFNGRVQKARHWWTWVKVTPGSTIVVPYKRMRPATDWGATVRDTVTFLGALATTILLVTQVLKK